jgi:hypothetical protein
MLSVLSIKGFVEYNDRVGIVFSCINVSSYCVLVFVLCQSETPCLSSSVDSIHIHYTCYSIKSGIVTIYVIMGDRDSLPANLKSMQPYLDMATDYESMDPFISYWCN